MARLHGNVVRVVVLNENRRGAALNARTAFRTRVARDAKNSLTSDERVSTAYFTVVRAHVTVYTPLAREQAACTVGAPERRENGSDDVRIGVRAHEGRLTICGDCSRRTGRSETRSLCRRRATIR